MTIYASSLFEGLGPKKATKKTDADAAKQVAAYKRAEALEKKKKKEEEDELQDEIEATVSELEEQKAQLEKKEAQKLKRQAAAAERKKQKEIEEAVAKAMEESPKIKKETEKAPKKRKVVDENEVPKWLPAFLEKYAIQQGKNNGEKPDVQKIREAAVVVAQEKWDDPAIRKKVQAEMSNGQNRLYAKMFPQ